MTKNIFIFTLLVSLLFSPSWSQPLNMNDLVEREGVYYKKFSDVPFNGEVSGLINGKFKSGKKDGLWLYYYTNGQLSSKGNYKDGKIVGEFLSYYPNGKLFHKSNWKNGIKEGLEEKYHELDILKSKGFYKDGKEDGYWEYRDRFNVTDTKRTGYYRNGVKQE